MRASRVVRRRLPINSLCSSALTTAQALPLRQARQATMTVFWWTGAGWMRYPRAIEDFIEQNDAILIGLRYAMPLHDCADHFARNNWRISGLLSITTWLLHETAGWTRRLFQDDGDTTGHGVTHIVKIFGDQNRRAAPDVTTMVTALSATLRRRRYWKSVADPVLWAQRSCSACIGSDRKNWFQQIINILTRAPISSS